MRAGSTFSPSKTSLFWMGDQLPTLDKYDGLHSALIGIINGGISGMGLGHSDIGGYCSVNQSENLLYFRRDEEVLMRWLEMNAFSDAVYRSHPSNNPAFNVQLWDSVKIAQFFKKFTDVFVGLGVYRKALMLENEKTGIPITRSLMFELDDTSIDIDDQFMLGSEVMMAPILVKHSTSRKVYFPKGKWQHLFTGE